MPRRRLSAAGSSAATTSTDEDHAAPHARNRTGTIVSSLLYYCNLFMTTPPSNNQRPLLPPEDRNQFTTWLPAEQPVLTDMYNPTLLLRYPFFLSCILHAPVALHAAALDGTSRRSLAPTGR